MLQTLALAAALSLAPAQNPPLALTNDRLTFGGEFGPQRPNNKLLPGDVFFLAFDIENLKLDPRGQAQYSIGMEVTDSTGKAFYSQQPADQEMLLPLGGNKLPARAFVVLKPEQAKGTYTCKVTVTDRMTRSAAKLEKSFEVLAPGFGTVCVLTTVDEEANISTPMVGVSGQPMWVHFIVVGFARDAAKQPNVVAEVRVYDEAGKPTTDQPLVFNYNKSSDNNKGVDEKVDGLPFKVPMPLNRAGTFKIEVKTFCKVSGQDYRISFPIKVMPSAR